MHVTVDELNIESQIIIFSHNSFLLPDFCVAPQCSELLVILETCELMTVHEHQTHPPTLGTRVSGSPMSFSNPILWHRGHNLTAHSEPRKMSRGVYQTFFSWFSDHSNPGQDDVAQVTAPPHWHDFMIITHRHQQVKLCLKV